MHTDEKRRSRRIEYQLPVFLHLDKGTTYGEIENLSDGGVFIKTTLFNSCTDRFQPEEEVSATFYFLGNKSTLSMTLAGKVVRVTETGLAFTSRELETSTFLNLESLVLLYDNDHTHLTEECLNHMTRTPAIPTAAATA